MIHLLEKKRGLFFVAIALSFSTLVSCGEKAIDFEFTGTVYDQGTKQPIEGAYVIATYKDVVVSSGGVASHCVKTKGMYTVKDGKFHFPVEKLDWRSPSVVVAIHVDYVNGAAVPKPTGNDRKQNAAAYSARDIYMVKQDPKNPDYLGNADVHCVHAKNKADAAASVVYYKIRKSQYVKFNRGQSALDSMDESIQRLESLDGRMPDEIRVEAVPLKN
jgi:hypothetical protein